MGFKQLFCKHSFGVKEAVFEYGRQITSQASKGLTNVSDYHIDATDYYACPKTIIKTHFVVNGEKTVFLYCKVCQKCGLVKACDAFDYEEYKKYHEILSSEGL
ncbi:MAG: hypothetical protein EKK63_12295 [Acinetobacter sp.]|uniref:hypothetical protein n=1 Tax=Acinetobacter sp. TaxID=472 RepID=UPI000FA78D2E|nr:hypothetical protein [Acinetobacter sp.]RUP38444.1 MAG: hypothetical protein EKK63_12295 [Acinetobacter sp.]